MLTNLSMWFIYISSYCLAYILMILEVFILPVVQNTDKSRTLSQILSSAATDNKMILIILSIFFISSVVYASSIKRWRNNCHIRYIMKADVTSEMTVMLSSYILPLVACGFNLYIGILLFIIMIAVGISTVGHKYLHACCLFLFLGYSVYKDDADHYVITKMKEEKYNLLIRDNPDGLEALRLSKNTYIICEQ